MTKNKVTELNIYMGIDTLQLTSAIPAQADNINNFDFVSTKVDTDKELKKYSYKVNPDKANKELIYNADDYFRTLAYITETMQIVDPIKTRIDFRFDSFADDYNEFLKLNKLLLLLLSEEYKIENRYESTDFLTLDKLTIRIQNQYLEVENYNKKIQEPNGIVCNRLELRSKKLYDCSNEAEKEYDNFYSWVERLNKSATKANFEKVTDGLNRYILQHIQNEQQQHNYTTYELLCRYENCILTSYQARLLFSKIAEYKDSKRSAFQWLNSRNIDYFTFADIQQYIKRIEEAGTDFFQLAYNNKKVC